MKKRENLKPLSLIKILIFTFVILLGFSDVWAQQKELELNIPIADTLTYQEQTETNSQTESKKSSDQTVENVQNDTVAVTPQQERTLYNFAEVNIKINAKEKFAGGVQIKHFPDSKTSSQTEVLPQIEKEKFHWKFALIESGVFLGFQHGFRMMQEKTTRELSGPFFHDWKESVKNLRGWKDGDNFFTNYIAHPGQGAITGRIFINNSDRGKKQEFGKSKKYWESRFKAMAWSAVWSTQFELGPISEASLGNVGLRQKNGHSTMAYVDLVMTPVAGTGLLILEDAVDKYFLRNWLEKKTSNKLVIKIARSFFTPTTSIANMLHWKLPWRRRSGRIN
jgi:hypothetical protein